MKDIRIVGLTVMVTVFMFAALIHSASSAKAADNKIVVGMVEAMSGPFKASGDRFFIAAKYAIDEINAKGGLLGKQVSLIAEDSNFKPDVAMRKTTKLILEDKADLILGSLGSHTILAMMKVVDKYKKVFLVYNSEASSVTGKDFVPYVFRNCLTTGQRAAATLSYLGKYMKYKKFYILCMDFALGRESGEDFKRHLRKVPDGQIVGEDYHPIGVKDFAPYVSKIMASGAEVILTANYGPDLSNLIRAGAQLGCKAITAGGYLFDPVILQDVQEAAVGHLVVHHSLIDLGLSADKKFYQGFLENHKNLDPVAFNPCLFYGAYHGYLWLFDVMRKAGSTDAEKIIQAWEGMQYEMPWGKVTMRACDHQIISPIKVAVIEKKNDFFSFPYTGKPVTIPEAEVTVPPAQTGNLRCK
jgi:branched-chain amino acid transport system substrate-binding protein